MSSISHFIYAHILKLIIVSELLLVPCTSDKDDSAYLQERWGTVELEEEGTC